MSRPEVLGQFGKIGHFRGPDPDGMLTLVVDGEDKARTPLLGGATFVDLDVVRAVLDGYLVESGGTLPTRKDGRRRNGRSAGTEYKARHELRCAMCGKEFIAVRADARFCSDACRAKHYRRSEDADFERAELICADCGAAYTAKHRRAVCPRCGGRPST